MESWNMGSNGLSECTFSVKDQQVHPLLTLAIGNPSPMYALFRECHPLLQF